MDDLFWFITTVNTNHTITLHASCSVSSRLTLWLESTRPTTPTATAKSKSALQTTYHNLRVTKSPLESNFQNRPRITTRARTRDTDVEIRGSTLGSSHTALTKGDH